MVLFLCFVFYKGFIALTTDIKVNYLSQITVDTGEIVATGKIDKLGRKVIFVSGELTVMSLDTTI